MTTPVQLHHTTKETQPLLVGLCLLHRCQLVRLCAQTVPIPEEEHILARTLGLGARLDPLAHACALVHGLDEANRSVDNIGAVVAAHNGLDGLGGLVGVVEGDGADVVVQDVRLDDAVQQVAADEAEFTVDGCSGTLDKGPLLAGVVGQGRVGVLEEGNSDCERERGELSAKPCQECGTFQTERGFTHQASG